MKKLFFLFALTAFHTCMAGQTLDLNSEEGEKRLFNSHYSKNYWVLNSHYLSQHPNSCAAGSAVMVLNALNIYRPNVEEYFGYPLFTQSKFLQSISGVITPEEIKSGLVDLEVLAKSLQVFSLDTAVVYADSLTATDFRSILKKTLNNPQAFIIANYHRPSIGHRGKGNFSPIGAYDPTSDSVLILDVFREQHAPFWVKVDDLLISMNKLDLSKKPRGLLLVERQYVEVFSEKGIDLMKKSQFRKNYFLFSRYFETQEHWTYCSIASSVAVMNALLDQMAFSQETFFTDEVQEIVKPEEVKTDWRGLTADELIRVVTIHGFTASFTSANTFNVDKFRETIKIALNDPNQFIIANYYRPQVNQVGGGHFSPIVAYEEESDSVLVMDTSRFKYAPVWINLNTFFKSMHTKDSNGLFRGYVTVKKVI